jgi:hypothetical protein
MQLALDQVQIAVVQGQVGLDARMLRQEVGDHRGQVPAAEHRRAGDPQRAAHRVGGGRLEGGLVVGQQPPGPFGQVAAGLGGRQAAGGALDQPRAHPLFQRRQGPGHGGGRAPQLAPGRRQAAGVDHRDQQGQLVQTIHFEIRNYILPICSIHFRTAQW